MFSQVGPLEIVLVAAIALLVLGPKRLPGAARSLGKGIREFKQSVSDAVPSHEELNALVEATPAEAPAVKKD
ncbi:MAG: twin-arginine translocase TatA/TatE family subunit [Actinomycetes bacterium]